MLETMISELEGAVGGRGENSVLVNLAGFGLEVFVPLPFLAMMPKEGEKVKIFTYLHVREDELTLYGFRSLAEKQFFLDLISVSNVGPKLAIKILGAAMADLRRAILAGDERLFPPIKGVGPKIKKAIVNTLQDKLAAGAELAKIQAIPENEPAIAALMQLGYSRLEAHGALAKVPASVKKTEERLREALRHL